MNSRSNLRRIHLAGTTFGRCSKSGLSALSRYSSRTTLPRCSSGGALLSRRLASRSSFGSQPHGLVSRKQSLGPPTTISTASGLPSRLLDNLGAPGRRTVSLQSNPNRSGQFKQTSTRTGSSLPLLLRSSHSGSGKVLGLSYYQSSLFRSPITRFFTAIEQATKPLGSLGMRSGRSINPPVSSPSGSFHRSSTCFHTGRSQLRLRLDSLGTCGLQSRLRLSLRRSSFHTTMQEPFTPSCHIQRSHRHRLLIPESLRQSVTQFTTCGDAGGKRGTTRTLTFGFELSSTRSGGRKLKKSSQLLLSRSQRLQLPLSPPLRG